MSKSIEDQPAPVPTTGPAVWDLVIADIERRWENIQSTRDKATVSLVIADMRERDRVGRERYGMPLQPHNGRDALVDAYQEALDLCAYIRQASEEGENLEHEYDYALALSTMLRARLTMRAEAQATTMDR